MDRPKGSAHHTLSSHEHQQEGVGKHIRLIDKRMMHHMKMMIELMMMLLLLLFGRKVNAECWDVFLRRMYVGMIEQFDKQMHVEVDADADDGFDKSPTVDAANK